jgi:porin
MKKQLLTISFIFLVVPLFSQEERSPINVEAAYVGEVFSNFSGGLKTGSTYLGLIDFGLGINTQDFGLWKNGEFFVQFENTHGGSPSGDFIGDLQVASNIENGNYSYMYEAWYKQQFGNLSLQLGLIDLNADYFVAEPGGLFLNSSFGIQPSASMNIPVPIFPMNSLAINLQYQISDAVTLQTGIWDGDPGDLDSEPYNTKWNLSKEQGFLSATELHIKHSKTGNNYLGTVKIGMTYHSANFDDLSETELPKSENFEFHLIAEQTLINKPEGIKGKLDVFTQLGYLPDQSINLIPLYIGAGLNYAGLLFNDASDVLGFACAYSGISKELRSIPQLELENYELAFELSYALPLYKNITIQPDLQYIINTGADKNLDNAFVGFIRIIIEH